MARFYNPAGGGTTDASGIDYNNANSNLISDNVQDAVDELDTKKLNASDMVSTVYLYPTTAASDIATYSKMVTSLQDEDYDDTAVNIPTGGVDSENQLIASLASEVGIIVGNTGTINVTTVGKIRKTAGGTSEAAEFYFEIYKREDDNTETLLTTSDTTGSITSTDYLQFSASALLPATTFTTTDRIVIKYYGNSISGNPEYDFEFGGVTPVRTLLPVPFSVTPSVNLDGLSDVVVETPTDNEVLAYNSTSGDWMNQTAAEAGLAATSNATLSNPTITNYTEAFYSVTGTSLTVDLSNGTMQRLVTTGNSTITLPSPVAGKSFTIIVEYGGSHTITWAGGGTLKWSEGVAPTLSSSIDIFSFVQDGTNTYGGAAGLAYG